MWIFRFAWDWLAFFALYVFIIVITDRLLGNINITTGSAKYLFLAVFLSAVLKMWWRETEDA